MASKSISARDQRIATATSLASSSGLSREQTISVTDLISEGEIEGLVNNEASIYLNNERVKEVIESSIVNSSDTLGGSQASIVNGSATFTVNKVLPSDTLIYGVSRWVILKEVYNSVVTIGSLTASDYEVQVPALTLSTGTAFFDSAMNTWEPDRARLIISDTQEYISGTVTTTTSTSAKFNPDLVSGIVLRRFTEAASGKSVSLSVDVSVLATSITIGASSSTITTPGQIPYPTGTYDFDLGSTLFVNQNPSSQAGNKFQGLSTQFRTGTADQLPMTSFGGVSATVLSNPVNFDLTFSDSLSENPSGTPSQPVTLTSTDSFNLSPAKAKEVDEVRVLFSYGSLFGVSERDGKKFSVAAEYKIEAKIYRTASEYNTVVLAPRRRHTANSNTAVTFEEKINLEPFQPFFKFDIIVTRLTRQDGRAVLSTGESSSSSSSKINATAKLTLATAIIKENLNYPFSAYANVTFSSKDFTSTPKRTYHARGIKVKVPSNYITREQNGTNLAEYDGLWDGSFYDYNVYTNNPAWVFYDILTNNRYGLGDWISSYDIDKFALYRIAKYCDELVPDGKGGQEPRFTSNIYLTKAADAYKVLKDITSSFLTMLYWLDGQMLSVMDLPKEAIYTFSGGNVKDGVFTYESTGTKTRANQVIVSWNNPDNDYKLEPLIVEDRQNIVDTGRIIEESAVAFGCTSEGQALRYGRWKLWTAINQTKVVSFSTSINAAFLTPGDIIKIQDQDQSGLAYSGRVSSTGTLDTNTIPLDREVILNAGSTYHLSVLIDAPAVSNEGEEEEHETLVETKLVTSTGTVTSLELSTPFTEVPGRSTIWALKETTAVGVSPASAKDYKILAISEESVSEYGIIAVEHYNEKFTDVDGDFTLIAPDTAFAQVKTNDFVPKPRNVYIESAPDYNRAGDEFRASWDLPQNLDGSFYDQCSGFEILHNIPGYDELLAVPSTTNSFVFNSVPNGSYFVAVRTVNSINNRSAYSTVDFDTINYFDLKVPRLSEGLGVGGTANSGLRLSDTYVLNFEDTPVSLFPSVNPFETFSGSITGVNTISGNLADDTYQVLFDSSAATLKIVKYHVTAEHKVNYWYDAIAANGTPENTFSSNTGTVTINAGSAIATGTGTSFTTEYAIGSIIRFSATQAAKVSSVTSDTEIVLDRSFTAAITASGHKSAGLNIDLLSDVVVAEITKSGNTSTLKSFTAVDTTLTGPAGAGVVPIYASDAAGNDQSYAQGSLEYVTYYEYVETKPTLPVTGETFIKFVGTDGTSEGVKPIFADDAAGTNATFTYSNQEFINFYEWTDSAPSTVPAGLTYVKYVGTDADALVIDSVDTSVAGQTTLSFSDGTSFTVDDGTDGDPGDTIGVAAIFASDAAGNGQSYTQGTLAYVNYYEYTNTKPTLPVTGQTFVKYIGTDGDSEGVIPIYATSAAGANATFTYSSQEFVNFYEWTGSSPTTVPTGLTYVKFVGTDGTPGDPGDAGLRTAHGYLYYEKTTAGAPSAPVGNTYTWSAGVVTGAGITHPASATNTWTNSAREQDATSTNTYYAVPYLVNETSAGSIVSVATYGTVIIHTNFTGVVTFDGTNLVDGTSTYNPASVINSNVTTIDGGKITTDSIDANKLSVGELSAITADLGSITAGTMKNSGANSIPDANSAPSGSEKGAHIDLDNGRFVFGDADQHILYDGTNLTIKGTLNADNIVGDVVDIIPFEAPQASATGTTAQQDAFAIVLDAASHAGGHIPTAIVSGYVKSGVDEKTYLRMFFKTDTAQSVSIGNVASVFVDAFKGTTDLTFNGDVSAAVGFGDFVTQGTVSGQVQSAFYDGTGITYVTIGSIPAPNYTVGPEAFAGLPANTYVQAAVTVCGRTGSSNQEKPFALTGSLGSHVTGIVTMKITLAKETTSNTVYMFNTTGIIMGVR